MAFALTKKILNDLLFFFIVLIYLFILQYKGEVIGFMASIQVVLIWISLSYSEDFIVNRKDVKV
jgi:hypothetical protein